MEITYYEPATGMTLVPLALERRGLPADNTVLALAGIYPLDHNIPAYDATYYRAEPSGGPHPKPDDPATYVQEYAIVPVALADAKDAKLAELSAAFDLAQATGHTLSVCGFEVDANETADRNVRGLIIKLEATGAPSTLFCDYTNTMRQATLAQLKTIQLEIIGYGEALYARKWSIREAINSAKTVEDVVAVTVSFDGVDA